MLTHRTPFMTRITTMHRRPLARGLLSMMTLTFRAWMATGSARRAAAGGPEAPFIIWLTAHGFLTPTGIILMAIAMWVAGASWWRSSNGHRALLDAAQAIIYRGKRRKIDWRRAGWRRRQS